MSKYVLGLNLSHDPSVCIVRDGVPLVAVTEERLNRKKKYHMPRDSEGVFWRSVPPLSLQYCLEYAGIKLSDVDVVVASTTVVDDTRKGIQRNLTVEDVAPQLEGVPADRIRVIRHHLSHAASTYFASGYDHSSVLILDGWGSVSDDGKKWEATTLYRGDGNNLDVLKSLADDFGATDFDFSYSLGALYTSVTRYVGFRNTEEGKTMGMAPFGKPSGMWDLFKTQFFLGEGDNLYGLKPALRYFKEYFDESSYERLFEILFGPPKKPGEQTRQDDLNIAFAVQKALEEIVLHLVNWLYHKTGDENLCLAGGVALNSVTNQIILDRTPIKNLFIQPGATDDGCCLGCALYGWRVVLDQPSCWRMTNAYLGRPYTSREVEKALRKRNGVRILQKDDIPRKTAQLLDQKYILGWFQGGSEFGPRALGHRSIITDSRGPETKDILNARVKHREGFRPFAPSVLLEKAKDYFTLKGESPYMLLVPEVLPDKRDLIPAVTHVDGTARVQTVTEKDNGRYYEMIKEFGDRTGTYVTLNTSFNVAGEPIVERPEDAIRCFLSTNIDYLVIEDYLLGKTLWGKFKGWWLDLYRTRRKRVRSFLKNRKELKKRGRWESIYTFSESSPFLPSELPFFLLQKPDYIVSLFRENLLRIRQDEDGKPVVNVPCPSRFVWSIPPGRDLDLVFGIKVKGRKLSTPFEVFVVQVRNGETSLLNRLQHDTLPGTSEHRIELPKTDPTDSVQVGLIFWGEPKDNLTVTLHNPDLRRA